jgi:hypothetical protein
VALAALIWWAQFPVGLSGLLVVALLAFAAIVDWAFFTTAYRIDSVNLILEAGPFRSTVPLSSVESVHKKDLSYGFSSGWQVPGLALFSTQHPGDGMIKMYAHSALKGVTLIRTGSGTYGVTPADEAAFEAAIKAGVGRCR